MFNKHLSSKPVGTRLSPAVRFIDSVSLPSLHYHYSSMKSSLPFFLSLGTLYLLNHSHILTFCVVSLRFNISTLVLSLEFDPSTSLLRTRQRNMALHIQHLVQVYVYDPR